MIILVSLLAAIIFALLYALSTNGKVQAISLALLTAAATAVFLQVGGVVKLL